MKSPKREFKNYLTILSLKRSLTKTFNLIKNKKFDAFRFIVKEWIMYWVHTYITYLLAPFCFHLGSYSWFIDFLAIGQEVCETWGFYILGIIIIGFMGYYRNSLLQVFTIRFYKNLWAAINRSTAFNYASIFFSSLKNSVLSLVSFLFSPFKRKKNKKNKKK